MRKFTKFYRNYAKSFGIYKICTIFVSGLREQPNRPGGFRVKKKDMEKKIIARGYNKNNERVSVIEKIEKDEMTCVGIYLVIDGEWFEYGNIGTAMCRFNEMCN